MNDQSAKITPEELDRLKRSVNIADLIAPHVQKMTRLGREFSACCPFHGDKTPSFSIVPDKGFYHCFGCGAHGDVVSWLIKFEGLTFNEAMSRLRGDTPAPKGKICRAAPAPLDDEEEARRREKKIAAARKIWSEARPAFGTIVEKYLASRGLSGVMIPPTIRFHPAVWNAEVNMTLPAMVGCVVARNQIVGVHRTYLLPDGSGKARVKAAKKMLGSCRGGHVRLADHGPRLAIAEGIETALSIQKACPSLAVWAALSLGNMDAEVPKTVRDLILCIDQDEKDRAAADRMIERAARLHALVHGRCVRIAKPTLGMDFNDMVRAG